MKFVSVTKEKQMNKIEKYKKRFNELYDGDIDEEVDKLFRKNTLRKNILFWYWHHKEMERLGVNYDSLLVKDEVKG